MPYFCRTFGVENSFLSALVPMLDFLPLAVLQTCWPTVRGGGSQKCAQFISKGRSGDASVGPYSSCRITWSCQ